MSASPRRGRGGRSLNPWRQWERRQDIRCHSDCSRRSIAVRIANAGSAIDTSLGVGAPGSRGLIRIRRAPRPVRHSWPNLRTDGIAVPAPISITTKRVAAASRPRRWTSCCAEREACHAGSPNIKMFGRAIAPHLGHFGGSLTSSHRSMSIIGRKLSAGQIYRPQGFEHCKW